MISLIWAQTNLGIIGNDDVLPWNIKEEMQHFIRYTKNKDVLMGKRTWDSLLKKPLPNRNNFILTTQKIKLNYEKSFIVNDLDKFLDLYKNTVKELVVIGGRSVYEQTIGQADKLIVSYLKNEFIGNVKAVQIGQEFKIQEIIEYNDFKVVIYIKENNEQ